jgi:hypothetical protein
MTASEGSAEAQKGVVDNSNDRARCGAATSPAAERLRRFRRRQRDGIITFAVHSTPDLRKALIAAGFIGALDRENRQKLSDAVDDLLDAWSRGHLTPPPAKSA